MAAWTRTDGEALDDLGLEVDALQEQTGVPVMSRRPWLQTWLRHHPEFSPLFVGVRGPSGSLQAVALLATRRRTGVTRVVSMGHGASDLLTTSATDDVSAGVLAAELAQHLRTVGPWTMFLRHHHPEDRVLLRLPTHLDHVRLADGDVSPFLRVGDGGTLDDHVSGSHRRGINRLRNRLVREGLTVEVEHVRDPGRVRALLQEVERLHRLRDDDARGRSAMDVEAERAFFHDLVSTLSARGEVVLTALHLDGALAAYALCFVDGRDHRMWNTRFDPAWSTYSPGKLVLDESIRHALDSGAATYDFMRGEERYKASYANDRIQAIELMASSSWALDRLNLAYLEGRERLRRMDESDEGTARVARVLRRAKAHLTS